MIVILIMIEPAKILYSAKWMCLTTIDGIYLIGGGRWQMSLVYDVSNTNNSGVRNWRNVTSGLVKRLLITAWFHGTLSTGNHGKMGREYGQSPLSQKKGSIYVYEYLYFITGRQICAEYRIISYIMMKFLIKFIFYVLLSLDLFFNII